MPGKQLDEWVGPLLHWITGVAEGHYFAHRSFSGGAGGRVPFVKLILE